jgi:hypothetical protein
MRIAASVQSLPAPLVLNLMNPAVATFERSERLFALERSPAPGCPTTLKFHEAIVPLPLI